MTGQGNSRPHEMTDPLAGIWAEAGSRPGGGRISGSSPTAAWLPAPRAESGELPEHLLTGSLVRIRAGVMARGSFRNSLSDGDRERAQLTAYCKRTLPASADGLTFSHTSAGRLHRLCLWRADHLIHVTIPYHAARGSHAADVRAHSGPILRCRIPPGAGICGPHVGVARRVIDQGHHCATEVPRPRAPISGSNNPRHLQIRLCMAGRPGRPGVRWKVKYFDYKPSAQVIYEEREREKLLTELGWRILRIGWKDLFDERSLKVRLLRLLGA
jgi:hypothetical protein